jgi:hypothetical protein
VHVYRYFADCSAFVGSAGVPQHTIATFKHADSGWLAASASAKTLWRRKYPSSPFDVPLDTVEHAVEAMKVSLAAADNAKLSGVPLPASKLTCDIVAVAQQQAAFHYRVGLPHFLTEQFLTDATERCGAFLGWWWPSL